jgi:hypothetical protein
MSLLGEGGLPSQPYIYVVGRAGVEKTADIVILRFDLVANQNEDRLCVCGIADVLSRDSRQDFPRRGRVRLKFPLKASASPPNIARTDSRGPECSCHLTSDSLLVSMF